MVFTRAMLTKALRIDPGGMLVTLPSTHQNNSPFLQLPGETRNRIYELILGGRLISIASRKLPKHVVTNRSSYYAVIEPYATPGNWYRVNEWEYVRCSLQILLVCKQIYLDARLLPFTLNTFDYQTLGSVHCIQAWRQQRPSQTEAIRTLRLDTKNGEIAKNTFEALPLLPDLRAIEFTVDVSSFNGRSYHNKDPSVFVLTALQQSDVEGNEAMLEAKVKGLAQREQRDIEVRFLRKRGWRALT
jgi:hypothetical protein